MAQLSISEICSKWSINRSTIFRATKQSKLQKLPNGKYDLAEIVSVFGEPKIQVSIQENTTYSNDALISAMQAHIATLEKQLAIKDHQIENFIVLLNAPKIDQPETKTHSANATHTPLNEIPQNQAITDDAPLHDANTSEMHGAIATSAPLYHDAHKISLSSRFKRGLKAFLK